MKKQRLIPMIIVFIMIMNCLLPIIPVKAINNNAIYFEKPLYEAVKAELIAKSINASYSDSKAKITITEENRAQVTSLDLKNKEISDLSGLEYFVNLEELNLSGNRLSVESNLEVLNNFQLRKLDLSSNYIEDISMIENYEEIESLSLQNQTIEKVTILDREAIDNLEEGKIKLPQIFDLIENLNEFVFDDGARLERGYGSLSYYDDVLDYGTPVINNYAPHTITLDLLDEEGNIKSGSIGFTFKINYGELINTTMNLYYVVIDENQRAAVFNDDNFYNTVKAQLTRGQNINDELDTEEKDLYHRAYDIAKVMVFDINTLINKIPSLEVSGKEIKDISGIETFVGLEKELDLSNNYIDSIEKLIELQVNKDKETKLLQERFKNQSGFVNKVRQELLNELKELEGLEAQIDAKLEELAENPEKAEEIEKELNGYTNEENKHVEGLYEKREKAITKANSKLTVLKSELNTLYTIYNDYYRTTTLLTLEISEMDEVEFNSREDAINALNLLFTKIANLETTRSLSDFERTMLISKFGISEVDEDGNKIENPIEAYFMSVLEEVDSITIKECKDFIEEIIRIDTKAQLNYNFPSIYANGENIEITNGNAREIRQKSVDELIMHASENIEKIINTISVGRPELNEMMIASNWLDVVRIDRNLSNTIRFTKEEQAAFERAKIEEDIKNETIDISIEVLEKITDVASQDIQNLDNRNREIVEKFLTTPEDLTELEIRTITNLYFEKAKIVVIDEMVEEIMNRLPVSQYQTKKVEYKETDENAVKILSQVLGISGKVVNLNEEEIEAWVRVPEIRNINLSHNCLKDIDGIEAINTLEVLNVSRNEISDISKVDWKQFAELKELYLQENAISNISMLDTIKKLEKLDVSKNKLSGKFNLDVDKLERLVSANFSENAYSDLINLVVNHSIEAGREDMYKYTYRKIILAKGMNFDKQYIKADLGKVIVDEDLYVTVPPIITQLERMKPVDTYFDYTGAFAGKITATGKAQLTTDALGNHTATLYAISENDFNCFERINYTVTYEVVKGLVENVDISLDEERDYAIIDGTTKFIAKIDADENVTDLGINWTVEGNTSTDTEIDENGVLYVAPDETTEKLTVTATSNYDSSKSANSPVKVKKAEVKVFIDTASNKNGIKTETAKAYTAKIITEANNTDFTWSIEGNSSEETLISEEGILYIAKDEAAGGKITVIATSDYNNEVFAKVVETVINEEFGDLGDTTEPENPGDTTGSTEPENPGDTTKPAEPENPGDTTGSTESGNPGDTTGSTEPENPGDTTGPAEPENPGDTTGSTESGNPTKEKVEIKYETKDEMVYVEKPNTTIAEFVKGLVDGVHTITVSDGKGNKINDYTKLVATGMVIAIDNSIEDTYEIIVAGDLNGDGLVDSMDSNLVKAHRVETKILEGAEFEAADVNKDGKVNKIDSFLLLYFRADKIDDFSKTTIDLVMK